MSKKTTRFRRTPEEIEQGLTVEQAKEARKEQKDKPEVIRAPKQKGLGDKVEDVLKATGIKAFVEFLNGGEPCSGCEKRKAKLNNFSQSRKAKTLTIEDIEFIIEIKDKNTLKASEIIRLYQTHARIYSYPYTTPGNCASCIVQRRDDLVTLYEAYNG